MEVEPQEGELGALVSSPEFARMVDRFAASTGLRLQVFDLDAHPLTAVEIYPRYCRLLQERKACPLYNDPEFLKQWINDPQTAKPGTAMPKLGLSDEELNNVVSFLETLK